MNAVLQAVTAEEASANRRADFVPVHNVPPCGNVVGATVLVVEVIGVFPDVNAQDRRAFTIHQTAHQWIVLVGCRTDTEPIALDTKPCPATAEACCCSGCELLLECIHGTECRIDCAGEFR